MIPPIKIREASLAKPGFDTHFSAADVQTRGLLAHFAAVEKNASNGAKSTPHDTQEESFSLIRAALPDNSRR